MAVLADVGECRDWAVRAPGEAITLLPTHPSALLTACTLPGWGRGSSRGAVGR